MVILVWMHGYWHKTQRNVNQERRADEVNVLAASTSDLSFTSFWHCFLLVHPELVTASSKASLLMDMAHVALEGNRNHPIATVVVWLFRVVVVFMTMLFGVIG